ncbi:hypothetical protein QOZ80_1BG0049210 [Eleusine coracana subsp. coracana]|nr:hypothetical protein QOZ80_1BG0049210 [Eleusine coracana subsp. coracana]
MDQSRRAVESYWRSRMVDGVTADDDKVAPVYKLEEICELLRASDASIVKEVADFILKRLDHKSPLVKQKALRLIKYAVGKSGTDFKREMQRHSAAMRQLVHYRGQPDPLRGDSLNKAVRETANEAMAAVFSTEDPKPVVKTESLGKRIQGFGNTNYDPSSRDDKKSFLSELSEVVGIGSASIKQGLSNFAAAQGILTNDNGGTYRGPNLRRSLTTESDKYGRYDPSEIQSESRASSGASKNMASGSWGPTPSSSSASTVDASPSQPGLKSREDRLLETIVTASGVRLQPTRDALQIFLTEASKLDAVALSRALENKLNSPLWQVRMKAVCVLEAIVRKQDTDPYSIIVSYFVENSASIVKCCDLPQVSLREKASKVLSLLVGEQPTGRTTKIVAPPPVQMPDLIDTGGQDDPETQSSEQESNGHITGKSAYVSSVDDLLGGEPIADINVTTDGSGSDPFADVSFHESETKESSDLFSGLTVEDKSSTPLRENSPKNQNELPDIFGSNPDPFIQENVMDKGTVNDLMAGLNLNGTGQPQPPVKSEPNSNLSGSQFFDTNNQTSHVANPAALNGILGQNSFYQQNPLQYSLPHQHMLLNQSFPGQQLNYGAMGLLLAQQQMLQSFGNFNAGLGQSSFNSMNSGSAPGLPDIFNSNNQPQNHVSVVSNSKKDDTRAFDFVSDHLAAARGSRK